MLAAVVESSSAKEQVSALLDLIDLQLSGHGARAGIAMLLPERLIAETAYRAAPDDETTRLDFDRCRRSDRPRRSRGPGSWPTESSTAATTNSGLSTCPTGRARSCSNAVGSATSEHQGAELSGHSPLGATWLERMWTWRWMRPSAYSSARPTSTLDAGIPSRPASALSASHASSPIRADLVVSLLFVTFGGRSSPAPKSRANAARTKDAVSPSLLATCCTRRQSSSLIRKDLGASCGSPSRWRGRRGRSGRRVTT